MEMKKILEDLEQMALGEELFQTILTAYREEMEQSGFSMVEEDYRQASEILASFLSPNQQERLARAEDMFKQETMLNIKNSFHRGMYAGMKLTGKVDFNSISFTTLVLTPMDAESKQECFTQAEEKRAWATQFLTMLSAEVDPFTAEHLVSIESAWDERSFAALRYGFHIGFHAAQSIAISVNPKHQQSMILNGWKLAGELNLPFELMA